MTILDGLKEKRVALEQRLKHAEAEFKKYQVRGQGKTGYAATQRKQAADDAENVRKIKAEIAGVDVEISKLTETSCFDHMLLLKDERAAHEAAKLMRERQPENVAEISRLENQAGDASTELREHLNTCSECKKGQPNRPKIS